MTTKDEALKMAIEWFEDITKNNEDAVLKACKEALDTEQVREDAVQPEQEPWGWYENHDIYDEKQSDESIALYTHPAPSWQRLTDDEISKVISDEQIPVRTGKTANRFARAIEQALRTKNGF